MALENSDTSSDLRNNSEFVEGWKLELLGIWINWEKELCDLGIAGNLN